MKAGKELENYVQFVYQKLLDFMDEGAMVSSNVSVIGKSGVKHEFDVYYEFQHLNMRHRIAIECKDWNTPVSKGEVGEFLSKLNDLNNISGMMVAKSGYQEGCKTICRIQWHSFNGNKRLTFFRRNSCWCN